jgi:hypothetical protein
MKQKPLNEYQAKTQPKKRIYKFTRNFDLLDLQAVDVLKINNFKCYRYI